MQSPFKMLDSYDKGDREIFFGRDREIEQLYNKVFESRLLLLYGASGTGKSSLIRCGLANCFDEEDWLAISVRRNQNINESFRETLIAQLSKSKRGAKLAGRHRQADILTLLHKIYLQSFKPIYLIFDQFEELLLHSQVWSEDEPLGSEEEKGFIDTVKAILESDLDCHILISMREEYLAHLDGFEEEIPGFSEARMRVSPMSRRNLREVISRSCASFQIDIEEGVPDLIIEALQGDRKGAHVPLPYLQVYMDKLYSKAVEKPEGAVAFRHSLLGSIRGLSDIMAEYLDNRLIEIEQAVGNGKLAPSLLKHFITHAGTKETVVIEEFHHKGAVGLSEEVEGCLKVLEKKNLIRRLDNKHLELAHDMLAKAIYDRLSQEEKEMRQALELVESRYEEYREGRGGYLGERELGYVKPFLNRISGAEEKRYVLDSNLENKKKREFLQRQNEKLQLALQEAKRKSREVLFHSLVARAKEMALRDPTKSLRLCQLATGIDAVGEQPPTAMKFMADLQNQLFYKTLLHRRAKLLSADFSSEHRLFAMALESGQIEVWSFDNNEAPLASFTPYIRFDIVQLKISPSGRYILLGSNSGYMECRSIKGQMAAAPKRIREDVKIISIEVSPTESFAAVGMLDGTLGIFTFPLLRQVCLRPLSHRKQLLKLLFSSCETSITTVSAGGKLRKWDFKGELLRESEKAAHHFSHMCASSRAKRLYVADVNGNIYVYNADFQLIDTWSTGIRHWVRSMAYSKERQSILIVYGNGVALVVDCDTGLVWHQMKVASRFLEGSWGGGDRIYTISDQGGVKCWRSSETVAEVLLKKSQGVSTLAFSLDNQAAYVGYKNGKGYKVNLQSRKKEARYQHKTNITRIALNKTTGILATASTEGLVRLWFSSGKVRTRSLKSKLTDKRRGKGQMKALAFSNDGRHVFTGGADCMLRCWNMEGHRLWRHRHHAQIHAIAWVELHQSIAFASNGLFLMRADGSSWEELSEGIDQVFSMDVTPSGQHIFAYTDKGLLRYDLKSRKQELLGDYGKIADLALSKEGNFIALASFDYHFSVLSMEGKLVCSFSLGQDYAKAIGISQDSQKMLVGTKEGALCMWRTPEYIYDWLSHAAIDKITVSEAVSYGLDEEQLQEFVRRGWLDGD